MSKREIFFPSGCGVGPGSYHMCQVLFWEQENLDYIIVETDKQQQFLARATYGTWCAIAPYDLLYELRNLKNQLKTVREDVKEECARKLCPDCERGRLRSYHGNFVVNHHWTDSVGCAWGSSCKAGRLIGYESYAAIPQHLRGDPNNMGIVIHENRKTQ